MALHSRSEGRGNRWRNEGRGDRTRSSNQRARVPAARELRPWAAGCKDTDTYASRLRSILCCHWQVGPTDPAGSDERRGRAFNERTFGRDDNGGFQQWDGRIDGPHNVCRRRNQAILRAGQIRVMSAIGGTNRTTSDVRSSVADPTLPRASSTARRGPASTRCQKSDVHPADRMPRGSISRIEAM